MNLIGENAATPITRAAAVTSDAKQREQGEIPPPEDARKIA